MKSRQEIIQELKGQTKDEPEEVRTSRGGIGKGKRSKRKLALYKYLQSKGKKMTIDPTKEPIRVTVGELDRQGGVSPHANAFQVLRSMFDQGLTDRFDNDGEWCYWLTANGIKDMSTYLKGDQ